MIAALKNFTDRLLGRGDATITVPSFDGALKPNQILEKAEIVGQFDAPEDLVVGPIVGQRGHGPPAYRMFGVIYAHINDK